MRGVSTLRLGFIWGICVVIVVNQELRSPLGSRLVNHGIKNGPV